jgi:hypothetical protein
MRASYDEKDTRQTKLSQCGALNCQNVMYFVGNLSSAMGNCRLCMQSASKPSFWIFYLNESAQQIASIFFGPATKRSHQGEQTVRTPEGVTNNSLGQNYEKNSFGERLVGRIRSDQRSTCG